MRSQKIFQRCKVIEDNKVRLDCSSKYFLPLMTKEALKDGAPLSLVVALVQYMAQTKDRD